MKQAKPKKHKYVAAVSFQTEERVTKKLIREYLEDVLSNMPFDGFTRRTVRVRTVDFD